MRSRTTLSLTQIPEECEQCYVPSEQHMLTHFPKDPNCPICANCKITKKPCRRNSDPKADQPTKFGESITADHMISGRDEASYKGDTVTCVILDRGTGWLMAYPAKHKSAAETKKAFMQFLGQATPDRVYTDGSQEFKSALEELGLPHDVSTPHRPQTNGVVERTNRRILEGVRCLLFQSGMPLCFWRDVVMTYCNLRNFFDVVNGKTIHEIRFGHKFKGFLLPFGCKVSYKPSGPDDDTHKFGPRTKTGIFCGYHIHNGGKWSGDYLVWEAEKMLQATEYHQLHLVRTKEIIKPQNYEFPFADNEYNLLIGDVVEKRKHDIKKKRKPSQSGQPSDTEAEDNLDDSTALQQEQPEEKYEPDVWQVQGNCLHRIHNTPRQRLFVPGPEDGCPVDLKYVDVMRDTYTSITDLPDEKRIEDFWVPADQQLDGQASDRKLSEWWTGKTTFYLLPPPPRNGYEWVFGRETRIQAKSARPKHRTPDDWSSMSRKARNEDIIKAQAT